MRFEKARSVRNEISVKNKIPSLNFSRRCEEFTRDNYPVVRSVSNFSNRKICREEEKAKQPLKRKVSITSLGPFSKLINTHGQMHNHVIQLL